MAEDDPFTDRNQRFTSPMRVTIAGRVVYDPYAPAPPVTDAAPPSAREVVAALAARRARRQVGPDRRSP